MGEETLRTFLEASGVPTARGRTGLLCVRERWASLVLQCANLRMHNNGESLTPATIRNVLTDLVSGGMDEALGVRRDGSKPPTDPVAKSVNFSACGGFGKLNETDSE